MYNLKILISYVLAPIVLILMGTFQIAICADSFPIHRSHEALRLEDALSKDPDRAEELIPLIEKAVVAEIVNHGPGDRFIIDTIITQSSTSGKMPLDGSNLSIKGFMAYKEGEEVSVQVVRPKSTKYSSSFTIKCFGSDMNDIFTLLVKDGFRFVLDFPGDKVRVLDTGPMISMGPSSIHRYRGMVTDIHRFLHMPLQEETINIVGDGGKANRLTFVLLEKFGYVYVRGKGRVDIDKNNKTIKTIPLGNPQL